MKRVKNYWFTVFVAGVFALAAGTQAITWVIQRAQDSWYQGVGWKAYEEEVLSKLGAGEQIGYVKQLLGEPIFRDGGDRYQEYVFKRKYGYIQTVADKNDKIVQFSVHTCRADFTPVVQFSDSRRIKMNVDTLYSTNFGSTYYSISGATANSYLMEGGYGGNPSNYQEIYVGTSDACGFLLAPVAAYELLEERKCDGYHLRNQGFSEPFCEYDRDDSQIKALRKKVKINTVVVTAPHVGLKDLAPYPHFGASRIELRILPNYNREWRS